VCVCSGHIRTYTPTHHHTPPPPPLRVLLSSTPSLSPSHHAHTLHTQTHTHIHTPILHTNTHIHAHPTRTHTHPSYTQTHTYTHTLHARTHPSYTQTHTYTHTLHTHTHFTPPHTAPRSFLLSYGVINLACFLCIVSGAPNFRPGFRWFSPTLGAPRSASHRIGVAITTHPIAVSWLS